MDDILFYGVLGVIIGGRLGYVLFYKPGYYLDHPLEILYVWQGGMAFHGGFLGVLVAMLIFARKTKKTWLGVMDFLAPLVPPGLAAGRRKLHQCRTVGGKRTSPGYGVPVGG